MPGRRHWRSSRLSRQSRPLADGGYCGRRGVVGISLRVPDASATWHPAHRQLGQDGWVYGSGYEFRLFPNWYEVPANLPPGDKAFEDDETTSGYSGYLNLTLKGRLSPGTPLPLTSRTYVRFREIRRDDRYRVCDPFGVPVLPLERCPAGGPGGPVPVGWLS